MRNDRSERMYQDSRTEVIPSKVSLESMTENFVGTLFAVWHGSKNKGKVPASVAQAWFEGERPDEASRNMLREIYPEISAQFTDKFGIVDYRKVVLEVAKLNLRGDLSSGECSTFTFCIDDAPIAWREQVVRSKVSSVWVQSSRIMDMSTMDIAINPSIPVSGGDKAIEKMKEVSGKIRELYNDLLELGVPMEDIRMIPQSNTHRVYWMISARFLIKILNKRCTWILQGTLWSPIMAGIISELRRVGLYDLFVEFLGRPMCDIVDGKVVNYALEIDNIDRLNGRDKLPPDPLYLASKGLQLPKNVNKEFYKSMKANYINIWQDEYLEVLGWDRHNPEKLGYYEDCLKED